MNRRSPGYVRRKTFPRRGIHTEISPLRCAPVEMTKGRATTLCGTLPSFVIPRGCDFFDFSLFLVHSTRMFFRNSHKTVNPERSASRIYRLAEGLQRVVEGPRGCLLADALHSFPATKTMREIKKSQPL